MPLSKKRMRERKGLDRSNLVKPKSLYPVKPKDMKSRLREQGIALDGSRIVKPTVQPIPNCPDGRHRELDADGNPIYGEV